MPLIDKKTYGNANAMQASAAGIPGMQDNIPARNTSDTSFNYAIKK